jgi:tetratricopeptide (TPR) repeat protein
MCAALAAGGVHLARTRSLAPLLAAAGILALGLLGSATFARNQVWGGKEQLWKSAVERYPDCARPHKALADFYMEDARIGEALEHYEQAVKILPAYRDAHVGVARAQVARMDLGQAMKTVDGIIERWPDDPKAWNLKGYIYQTVDNPERAMEAYQRAVEKDPKFAEGYNNLAQLYAAKGDVESAIRMYNTALEHDPSMVVALRNLAVIYGQALGNREKADWYEQRAAVLLKATR